MAVKKWNGVEGVVNDRRDHVNTEDKWLVDTDRIIESTVRIRNKLGSDEILGVGLGNRTCVLCLYFFLCTTCLLLSPFSICYLLITSLEMNTRKFYISWQL